MSSKSGQRTFKILERIASGGFGTVYLAKVAHGDGFNRLVAVKLLHPTWADNVEVASRMRDEARLLGMLRHKNIIDVLDLTLIDKRCAVVMEYLEAVDFRTVLEAAEQTRAEVPWRPALEACAEVASALDAAYNRPPYEGEKPLRVIHRDIKPSNIMVDEAGAVKVLDFGVARADFDERESHTQDMAFGSLEYMPPERLFLEPDTSASDVYSLGTTLYEIVFGDRLGKARLRPKMQKEFIAERMEDLFSKRSCPQREALESLVTDMLAYDGSDRPAAAEVATRLRAIARSLDEPSLAEWAEAVVPSLRQALKDSRGVEDDPLVGQTVQEDGLESTAAVAPEPVPERKPDGKVHRPAGSPPPPPPGMHSVSTRPGDVGKTSRSESADAFEPPPTDEVEKVARIDPTSTGRHLLPDPETPKRSPLVWVALIGGLLLLGLVLLAVLAGAGLTMLS